MDNLKSTTKQIRSISNKATLPLLTYIVLYLGFSLFIPDLITDTLLLFGIGLSTVTEVFIRYIFIYLLVIPMAILSFKIADRNKSVPISLGLRKPQKSFGWCAKWTIIAIGTSTMLGSVPTLISMLLQKILDTSASPTNNLFAAQSMSMIAVPKVLGAMIPTLVFAPIIEELLFRGTIFKNNLPLGEFFSIAVSGIFFGLWHQNLPQIFTTAFFGMFACFIYLRTKSIFPAMIAHFCNNLMVIIRDLIGSKINLENLRINILDTLLDNWVFILLYILYAMVLSSTITMGVVFFIIEIVKRNEIKFTKSDLDITPKRKILAFFTAPITLIVTVYLLVISVLNTIFGYYWFTK